MNDIPKKTHRVRCRSGELALVIGELPGREANIGRFVRVLRPAPQWSRNNRLWQVQPVQPTPWVIAAKQQELHLENGPGRPVSSKPYAQAFTKRSTNAVRNATSQGASAQGVGVHALPVVGIEDRFLLAIRDTVLLGDPAPKQPPIEPLD